MKGLTFKAMEAAAPGNQEIAARVELLLHRVPEEFFDLKADPDALHNLVNDPKYQNEVRRMREELLSWMEKTKDPLLEKFRLLAARNNPM